MNTDLLGFVDGRIEQRLLYLHTAFLGRIVSMESGRAGVQPLTLVKYQNDAPHAQPLLAGVPVLRHVEAGVGDVCLCVCCERDISRALSGQSSLPAKRHHSLSDAVVVGVF